MNAAWMHDSICFQNDYLAWWTNSLSLCLLCFQAWFFFSPLHLDWWIGPWLWSFLVHRGHYESNSEVAAIQPFFLLLILPPRCVCHSGWVVFSHFEIAFSLPAIFYACQVEKKELRRWIRRDSRPLLIAQRDDDEYSTRWDDFPMHCSFTKKEDFFLSKIK